ncbi:MAG: hypothetical protein M3Y54_03540 [Bacteroidota bacterium]|nr:hypothetical protein [Bacteroidota bacterium]
MRKKEGGEKTDAPDLRLAVNSVASGRATVGAAVFFKNPEKIPALKMKMLRP